MNHLFRLLLISLFSVSAFANSEDLSNIDYAEISEQTIADLSALDDMDSDSNSPIMLKGTRAIRERSSDKDLAKLVVIVNRAPKGTAPDAQKAKVYIDGRLERTFNVSTGKIGYLSRTGYFRPTYTNHLRVYDSYYSSKYNSLMSKAIFYSGGYAIHHTNATANLGKRASHGCVRFHIDNISWINDRARELGNQNTVKKKWRHANHANTSRFNTHYKGLERAIYPINRYSGSIDYSKKIKSVDMVVLVKDEMSSDR